MLWEEKSQREKEVDALGNQEREQAKYNKNDIGVAFQSHPVGQASSRVEAKDSTILSIRNV